jgi:uncharacterized protein YjiS (DUF1127 family)
MTVLRLPLLRPWAALLHILSERAVMPITVWKQRQTRRCLEAMTDYQLKDIGLHRSAIEAVSRMPIAPR